MTTDPPHPVGIVGTGYLGMAVATSLPGPVIATTRSGAWREGSTPPGVQMHALDVSAASLDPTPLHPVRSAVLCYAPGRTQDRRTLYVDGTRRLLERWGAGSLRRLVWVGSTSALPSVDAWLDERCEQWPDTERGRVQREAEAVVIEHAERHRIPWFVLRLGGLYGPGRELSRIYRRRRDEPLPGDGMAPTNLIHRDDAVQAVRAALSAPGDLRGVVHVVDDDHTPRRELYDRMARRGRPPVRFAEPVPPDGRPRGKRVLNHRLKAWLGVRLTAPSHRFDDESQG